MDIYYVSVAFSGGDDFNYEGFFRNRPNREVVEAAIRNEAGIVDEVFLPMYSAWAEAVASSDEVTWNVPRYGSRGWHSGNCYIRVDHRKTVD